MRANLVVVNIISLMPVLLQCNNQNNEALKAELQNINLSRGEIALCGSGEFGQVDFSLSCEAKVRSDFNLATALLHSFEYAEAEKVFAKIIDQDPQCVMAYWGVAMSNFHPLWAPPTKEELSKGSRTIALARKLNIGSAREARYVEAIATVFDNWEKLHHKTRVEKFVEASKLIYQENPEDKDAAVFYALALRASADPEDKMFKKQKRAGEILNALFQSEPNHPGVAHYIIHNYDYPELAELALPAARKYSSIAATSAHAQHMPSHIFTRLGLWEESIQSNRKSMEAAKCYAEKLGKQGHWDQELHGLDYLVYAYLQQGRDREAKAEVDYLRTINEVFPITFVNAYTFAATPVRYTIEQKDWQGAAALQLHPSSFPWERFPWQKAIFHFGRVLGCVHTERLKQASVELEELKKLHSLLITSEKTYEAKQVQVQILASDAWIMLMEGKHKNAINAMVTAADLEDTTEKHSVTPGEVAPARELLGDMYLEVGDYENAYNAYVANLKKRPGRFNSIYGAAVAAKGVGDSASASKYFQQLTDLALTGDGTRLQLQEAKRFLSRL